MNTHPPKQPINWKEGRRLRAWELARHGWKQAKIAEALGVSEGAVSQWLKRGREGGQEALYRQPPPGPTPKLTADQRAALPSLLAQGAPAFGFVGDLWTNPRIAALIEREFGVRYHPAHISRLLREIGWTSQKPTTRATQRDEEAITRWETERWPALKKEQKRKDGRLSG
jgi:transposase